VLGKSFSTWWWPFSSTTPSRINWELISNIYTTLSFMHSICIALCAHLRKTCFTTHSTQQSYSKFERYLHLSRTRVNLLDLRTQRHLEINNWHLSSSLPLFFTTKNLCSNSQETTPFSFSLSPWTFTFMRSYIAWQVLTSLNCLESNR